MIAWNLISDDPRTVARDPQPAYRNMVSLVLDEVRRGIDRVAAMPESSRDLIQEYRAVQLRASGSSVYLADPQTVNARLQDVVGDARREILAAQPGGPRKREVLEGAVSRDSHALDRGVELRTIYRDTVRDHALTAEYARTMAARTGGRPAQYRTVVGDFERMVIVDREQAVVPDHIVEGSAPHAAWLVTDPAVVAVLAQVFEAEWRRGQPWSGELRARGGVVDTVSGTGGVRTNARQRVILRYLCAEESQPSIARKLEVSKRALETEIAELKALWGVHTLNGLVFQYALSPDRLIDDSAAAEDGPETAVA
ncbi:hypothetical protein [Streptomyces cylindrosporus]|uniref:Uncharacterized protein n=1 Tax=Streptomyces cylindrosporus TaxID=2927583 RepID=A0ABS9YPT1_9ACTN|nr:hypothetical protein [Streptomyces cylindrosporus]MCI3279144.1 hypothetical protein [Streptomyces cylindrosporus]